MRTLLTLLVRGAGDIHGPARLTHFLDIDGKQNEKLALPSSGLWFEDRGMQVSQRLIERAARVGVSYAGKAWETKPYRFILKSKLQ